MNKRTLVVSVLCFVTGFLFLALQRQWIIFRLPFQAHEQHARADVQKRGVRLFYWLHDKWNSESTEVIWSANKAHTIKHLVDSWLTLMDEEQLMDKKVSLQSAILSFNEQEVFLSFDRNPFTKESPTFEKWMWVEGLLKTLRDNDIKIQTVRFLVHHQDMHDADLDFSNAWPVIGFLVSNTR